MREPITFRKVLDEEGNFLYLQLLQGENIINLQLGQLMPDERTPNKWPFVRETIDRIAEQTKVEAYSKE